MLNLVLALLTLAVIAGVAALFTGFLTGGGLAEPESTVPLRALPEGRITAADVAELRFVPALRGYRMDQVDAAIDRLEAEIETLRARLGESESITEAELDEPETFGPPVAVEPSVAELGTEPAAEPELEPGAELEPEREPQVELKREAAVDATESRGEAAMALFVSRVEVNAPPEVVFTRLTDWPAHARWVPFTTIRVLSESATGVGARFTARSGLGRLGYDDPMEVVEWQPPGAGCPGICRVIKVGRVLLGTATLEVRQRPGSGSAVSWTEDVQLAPVRLTRPLAPVLSLAGRLGFDHALRMMKREVEAEQKR